MGRATSHGPGRAERSLAAEPHVPLGPGVEGLRVAYEGHRRAVYAVLCRSCGPELAADVTQEVFLRLWWHPDRFDPERGSLRTFLLTMAHGMSIDRMRADGSRRAREERVSRHAVEPPDDVDHGLLVGDERERVAEALARLSDVQREAIVTTFYGGCTYREAGVALGIPEGTIKARIRQGLKRLKTDLMPLPDAHDDAGALGTWVAVPPTERADRRPGVPQSGGSTATSGDGARAVGPIAAVARHREP